MSFEPNNDEAVHLIEIWKVHRRCRKPLDETPVLGNLRDGVRGPG